MNSKTLIETGFSECIPLKNITLSVLPQDKSSVLILVDNELLGKPESDILYIGRTKKIAKKIMGGYLAGYGGKTTKKINKMLFDEGYIEKTLISWTLTDKPRLMQKEMLSKFKEDHGNLPSWNSKKKISKKPKITPEKTKKRVPTPKTKKVSQKVIASSTTKIVSKPKSTIKKPVLKEDISVKTESMNKKENAPEAPEKARPDADSTNQTTT